MRPAWAITFMGITSSAGSGGFRSHIAGVDRSFEFWEDEKENGHATLALHRLLAQIRHDLERRRDTDERTEVPFHCRSKEGRKCPIRPVSRDTAT